jgi:hypothetical protein
MTDIKTQAADLIEKAVDILVTGGWCTNFLLAPDGRRHCAVGALIEATGEDQLLPGRWSNFAQSPIFAYSLRAIAKTNDLDPGYSYEENRFTYWSQVATWNNESLQPERVINGMREAAKDLRNEASPE